MFGKSYFILFASIIALFCLPLTNSLFAQNASGVQPRANYKSVLKYLLTMETEPETAVIDSLITIERDVGTIKLLSGTIYSCSKYKNESFSVYFEGEGSFSFLPPTKIEHDQLYRFYDQDDIPIKFHSLFLLFTDSTFTELSSYAQFKKGEVDSRINENISDCIKYLTDTDVGNSRSDLIRSILDGGKNGFFYSHIEGDGKPIYFQINPYENEEVTFMRSFGTALIASDKKEIINQFPARQEYNTYDRTDKYFMDFISYRIESVIEDNLDFSSTCTIDFTSKEKNERWATLYLYEELEVDSVIWDNGHAAKFFRMPLQKDISGNDEIWIVVDQFCLDGNQHQMKFYYHGDLLEKNQYGWIALKSASKWYPRYDYKMKSYYGLIFHSPAKYELVSVGDLFQKKTNEEITSTTWLCNDPIRNASFNIGKFEKEQIIEKNLPTVNVYMSEYGHNQIGHQLAKFGILTLSDAIEQIGFDVINSLSLYEKMFGKITHPTINVTEVPYFHGLAFPGLIHLSWSTYQFSDFDGADEIFRAHEVAHQWWGIGVDYKTYHDKWLSEGFAEYSALLYLQSVNNDNDLFFENLERWRDEILNNRVTIFGSGQQAGPVWLGYRTQSTRTEGDYQLIIYKKGAYILHMLRGMLLDLKAMNEDRFKNLMKDYFKKFHGKKASTEDFQKIVSKHFGEDMSWFFNQFVYGTDLPLYRFAYKSEETQSGKFKITCRVIQENVPDNFKMYIPIKLVYDDQIMARFRIEMKTKEKIFTLPVLSVEPDDIIFNDLESVLCEVDYESWD